MKGVTPSNVYSPAGAAIKGPALKLRKGRRFAKKLFPLLGRKNKK